MKKYIKSLFLMIVVIGFFVVGKNVYAFDNDVAITINAVNRYTNGTTYNWVLTSQPFITNPNLVGWSSMTRTYVYGGYGGVHSNGTEISYVRALGGSFYAPMEPSKNYIMEFVTFHGQGFYTGQYGQGKMYNPNCSLQVDVGGINNVSCTIEQNTYVSPSGVYYDRIRFYFTSSANQYSNVLYTWQVGNTNSTDYVYVNTVPTTTREENYIGWDNIYFGYSNEESTDGGIGGVISSLDRNNATQQQTNTILGQIRELISNFKNNVESGINTITGKLNDIISSIGQTIGSTISNIWNFISSNVLGLDDIDDTLQDFVDSIDDNGIMGDIHDFLLLPVEYLNYIRSANNYCTDISFTMWNKEIIIPSGCIFWNRLDVRQFRTLWNTLFGGAIIFSLSFKYFKVLHNALDPTKDDLGGMEV